MSVGSTATNQDASAVLCQQIYFCVISLLYVRCTLLFDARVMPATNFGSLSMMLLVSLPMFVLATLMSLINQVSGTPYIVGGDSPAGTDC
jgi:cell wall-associated NlpC family hydrolase